jgi:acetyl esterase/lipase
VRAMVIALLASFALPAAAEVVRDVVYTPPGWPEALAADLHLPPHEGPRPAVLVVHGGGWERRTRADMDSIAARLAERGFVAMNVSYRFAPAYRFPAQLHDLQQALRWLRAAAPLYNVDPQRIGAFGYSAGGHLAALLGTVSTGDPLDAPHGGARTRLQAVVAGGAPTDLRKFPGGKLVPQFLGTTLQQDPALFALASPVAHVSRDDPPMFLYHGRGDRLVDASHSTDLKQALDAAGVRAELHEVPLLGHVATFLLARGAEERAFEFLENVLSPR